MTETGNYYIPDLLEESPPLICSQIKDIDVAYYMTYFLDETFPLIDISEYPTNQQALEITAFILLLRHACKRVIPCINDLPQSLQNIQPLFDSPLTLADCLNTDGIALCVPLHNTQKNCPRLGIRYGIAGKGSFWPQNLGEKGITGKSHTLADNLIAQLFNSPDEVSTAERLHLLKTYVITGNIDRDDVIVSIAIGNKYLLNDNSKIWICPKDNERDLLAKNVKQVIAVRSIQEAYEQLRGATPSQKLLQAIVDNDVSSVRNFVKKVNITKGLSDAINASIKPTTFMPIRSLLFHAGFEDDLLNKELQKRTPNLPKNFLQTFFGKIESKTLL